MKLSSCQGWDSINANVERLWIPGFIEELVTLQVLPSLFFLTLTRSIPPSPPAFRSLGLPFPAREVTAGLGRLGRKSSQFLLWCCLQLPISGTTGWGPSASPGIDVHGFLISRIFPHFPDLSPGQDLHHLLPGPPSSFRDHFFHSGTHLLAPDLLSGSQAPSSSQSKLCTCIRTVHDQPLN